ncbi:MAG TPA: carbohydrate binding family 9 domain-containing protein, partial [Polyangia bacterium]
MNLSSLLVLLTLPLPPVVDVKALPSVASITGPFDQPTIDGQLDEPLWRAKTPVTKFLQDEPNEGAPVSERTEVVLAIDGGALYVGARLFDSSPDLIKAQLARRDDDVSSDQFMLYLDPHRDRLSGVYFGVNAAGTQYDGTLTNDDGRDSGWDAVWESAVVRDNLGWKVEMRIPLSQLRFDGAAKRAWGINLERWIDR